MSRPERVRIPASDGAGLAGIFQQRESSLGTLVLSHCFTCSKDYKLIAWLARWLADLGWDTLRFDFRGLGQSEGDFAASTLSDDVSDLQAACAWLQKGGVAPVGLIGHSMGGTASILAAGGIASVQAVAVIGTAGEADRVKRILEPRHWEELEREGRTDVPVVGRPYPIGREFVEDLANHSLAGAMEGWGRRLAILHGTEDDLVPVESAEALFAAAPRPRTFFPMIGADHLVTNRLHAERAARFLDLWFRS